MPKRETLKNDEYSSDEEFDPEKYLRSLDLADFINCDDTREIMINEHRYNFERKLIHKLADIYSKFNYCFRDENLFGKDWDNELGEQFAEMIFNYISINYDVTLFYDCPPLAIELLSKKYK